MGKILGGALLVVALIAISIFAMDALNGGELLDQFLDQFHKPGVAPRY